MGENGSDAFDENRLSQVLNHLKDLKFCEGKEALPSKFSGRGRRHRSSAVWELIGRISGTQNDEYAVPNPFSALPYVRLRFHVV